MTLYRSSFGAAEAVVLTASRRARLEWVAFSMLPLWLLCGAHVWATFIEPELPRAFFWAMVAVCVVSTTAVVAMTPRRVSRGGNSLMVRYCLGLSRSIDLSPTTRVVWMPHFRTYHEKFGLLLVLGTGRRRLRLDTRLFPAERLLAMVAGTCCLEHIPESVTAGQMQRKYPGLLPLRDSHPVLRPLFGTAVAVLAIFGIPIVTGLVPL